MKQILNNQQPASAPDASPSPQPSQVERLGERLATMQAAQGGEAQAATTAEARYPDAYDGMSYANIIEAWLQAKGIYGGVAQGNRNNMFYQLAMDLRYICDFKKEWLLQVMPTWEMPKAERESTIQSALNRPQGRNMPEPLLAAIERVKGLGELGELDTQAVSNELRNPLPKTLPYVFRLIARRFPNNPHAMILCSLPPLGALCTNVRAEYIDGEEESPLFYCILTAPQASGKKVCRKIDSLLAYPIKDHDDAERQALMDYKKELKLHKNDKKQPEEPTTHIRKVPAKISQRVFLERTYYAEGKSLYSFAEELDSLTQGMKGGSWSNLSDILRLGFDGGEFGSDYASENSFAAVCQARWCMLMAGTWGAVDRFFPNLEDGTMTRFMFAQLEDNQGKPLLPKKSSGAKKEEEAIREEAMALYDLCSQDLQIKISLPNTTKALLDWQDLQIRIWELGGRQDTALDTLRRRSMLMGFRAALVASATDRRFNQREAVKNAGTDKVMKADSPTIADFAVWVAQEVLDQQMALFAKQLNQVNRNERRIKLEAQSQMRTNSTLKLLAELPDTFTVNQLQAIRGERGFPDKNGALVNINRWLKKGVIMQVEDNAKGENQYKKVIPKS